VYSGEMVKESDVPDQLTQFQKYPPVPVVLT